MPKAVRVSPAVPVFVQAVNARRDRSGKSQLLRNRRSTLAADPAWLPAQLEVLVPPECEIAVLDTPGLMVDERKDNARRLEALVPAGQQALGALDAVVRREATLMAFNDCFHVLGLVLVGATVAAVLCRPAKSQASGAAH